MPQDSFPRDGQTVKVMRITGAKEIRETPVPFPTIQRADPTLFKGTQLSPGQGRPGTRAHHLPGAHRQRRTTAAPEAAHRDRTGARRPQIVRVGTMTPPTAVAAPTGSTGRPWPHCESRGRPDAVDSSGRYGGLYQFDRQTWQALGGHGSPQDAPPAEQTYRAKKLYVQRGSAPWPHCGQKLRQ